MDHLNIENQIPSSIMNLIRSEAFLAEQQGKLTEKQLGIIYENKWFHLLVPKAYGGEELDLPSFALLMEEMAAIDGAFAWNVNLGAGANLFAGYMDPGFAKPLFLDPKTCIAGSGMVSGKAIRIGDHFEIEGHWKYASGSAHATLFSLNAHVEEATETTFYSFVVPAAQVEVLNTWKTTGLKATASHDFKVTNGKVHKGHSFSLLNPSQHQTGTLYRFSFQVLAEINMLVMTTGLAMRFWELAREVFLEKRLVGSQEVLAETPQFKAAMESKMQFFYETRSRVFLSLRHLWAQADQGKPLQADQESIFTKEVLACAQASRELVDAFYPYLGMHMVFEGSALNRVWRDFKVASQHILLTPSLLP